MGGLTPVYRLRYPYLTDPADITQIRTLAQDVEAALQVGLADRSQSRTYEKVNNSYIYIPNNYMDVPNSLIAVTVPAKGAYYHAIAHFDVYHVYGPPLMLVSGYLALDGAPFADYWQRANAQLSQNSRVTMGQSWAGQLVAGTHNFTLKMSSDNPGGYAHFCSKLSLTILQ
jgi:hypothetical protein